MNELIETMNEVYRDSVQSIKILKSIIEDDSSDPFWVDRMNQEIKKRDHVARIIELLRRMETSTLDDV